MGAKIRGSVDPIASLLYGCEISRFISGILIPAVDNILVRHKLNLYIYTVKILKSKSLGINNLRITTNSTIPVADMKTVVL